MSKPVTLDPATARQCGTCQGPVLVAYSPSGRVLLLDFTPHPAGAVGAAFDSQHQAWRARFLRPADLVEGDEARYRQHEVTCTGGPPVVAPPLVPLPDITETTTLDQFHDSETLLFRVDEEAAEPGT